VNEEHYPRLVDYYYSAYDMCTYIVIEDRNLDSAFITSTEALDLLDWLQEQRSNIEAIQEQENTK
jgi:hypothetical protein